MPSLLSHAARRANPAWAGLAALSLVFAGCASTPSDEAPGTEVSSATSTSTPSGEASRPQQPGTRYLTTIGAPGSHDAHSSDALEKLAAALRPIESIPVRRR